jgi:hypothetical protein
MSGRNCKLIVVKPERRGGYMPSPMMTRALKEARPPDRRADPLTVKTMRA